MCYITKSFFGILSCFLHELMKIHCRPERNPKHRGRNITTLLFLKPIFIQGYHTRGREPRWRRSWTWRRCSCASSSSSSSATSPGSSSTATSFSPARRSSGEQMSEVFLCRQTGFKILVEYYTCWWNMSVKPSTWKQSSSILTSHHLQLLAKRSLAESP